MKLSKVLLPVLISLLTANLLWQPALAELSNFQRGYVLFQKNDLKNALPFLEKGVEDDPRNSDCLYYYALTLHKLGRKQDAVENYRRLMISFPGTIQAHMAKVGLKGLDPHAYKSIQSSGVLGSDKDSTAAKIPATYADPLVDDQGYFRGSNQLQLNVRLPYTVRNGKPVLDVIFDRNWPAQAYVDFSRPVGYMPVRLAPKLLPGVKVTTKPVEITVGVGQYTRSQQKIQFVNSSDPIPTLGKDFFEGYDVRMNQQQGVIELALKPVQHKISLKRDKGELFEVPYWTDGTNILVEVDFGSGRRAKVTLREPTPVWHFNRAQWDQIGPDTSYLSEITSIPEANDPYVIVTRQTATLRYVKLGLIEKMNEGAEIVDQSNARNPALWQYNVKPNPLMPPGFYAGWDMRVDDRRRVVMFSRRGAQR
jgi:tetratricopeptide (TPR) repeat protein